jgi:hypothetical protein
MIGVHLELSTRWQTLQLEVDANAMDTPVAALRISKILNVIVICYIHTFAGLCLQSFLVFADSATVFCPKKKKDFG